MALTRHVEAGGLIADFEGGERLQREAIIGVDCDILVPAARPDVIRADNQATVKAKLIVPGANIGVTERAEAMLHVAACCAYPTSSPMPAALSAVLLSSAGGTEAQVFPMIDEKIRGNTAEVLERMKHERILPREAAVAMARERLGRSDEIPAFQLRMVGSGPKPDVELRAVS